MIVDKRIKVKNPFFFCVKQQAEIRSKLGPNLINNVDLHKLRHTAHADMGVHFFSNTISPFLPENGTFLLIFFFSSVLLARKTIEYEPNGFILYTSLKIKFLIFKVTCFLIGLSHLH